MQLDEPVCCSDGGSLLALLVVRVGGLDLRLLRVAPVGEARLERFIMLDREVVLPAVQRLLRFLIELRGRPAGARVALVEGGTSRQQQCE